MSEKDPAARADEANDEQTLPSAEVDAEADAPISIGSTAEDNASSPTEETEQSDAAVPVIQIASGSEDEEEEEEGEEEDLEDDAIQEADDAGFQRLRKQALTKKQRLTMSQVPVEKTNQAHPSGGGW